MGESGRSKSNGIWKFFAIVEIIYGSYLGYSGYKNTQKIDTTKAISLTDADSAGQKVKVSDLTAQYFKAYLNLGTEFDKYLISGYVTAWGGLITFLIGSIGLFLFIKKRTDNALAWSRSLSIYPIMFLFLLCMISKYPESASVLISLFAAIITTSATIALWGKLWEQVFTTSDANKIDNSNS